MNSCFEILAALFLIPIGGAFLIAIGGAVIDLFMKLTHRPPPEAGVRDSQHAPSQKLTTIRSKAPHSKPNYRAGRQESPQSPSDGQEGTSRGRNRAGGWSQVQSGSDYHHGIYHPYRGGSNMDFMHDGGYSASIVFGIKRGKDTAEHRAERREAVDRFCHALTPLLPDDCVLTWFPSSDPQKVDTGIRDLAMALSERTGLPCEKLLLRRTRIPTAHLGGARNIEIHLQTIEVTNLASVRGRHVLVLDDVTTSGSSLKAARQLLQQSGASVVTTVALGRTQGGSQIAPCDLVPRTIGPDCSPYDEPRQSAGVDPARRYEPVDDDDIPF